jgi:hypothetical protein
MAKQPKQFTRKGIEKLFKTQYPAGEINIEGSTWSWWWTENENSRTKKIHGSNLYDVAEELMLKTYEEIHRMKIAAGYREDCR